MLLDCKYYKCFSVFFSPLKWDRVARMGWSWVFFFLQVSYALIIPQKVRFCLISYPWGLALLQITECFLIKMVSFPFLLPEAQAPRWKFHNIVLLEFLTLNIIHTELPAIYQFQFRFSYPNTGSCGGSSSWIWSSEPWLILFPCLFLNSWGQQFVRCSPLLWIQEQLLLF